LKQKDQITDWYCLSLSDREVTSAVCSRLSVCPSVTSHVTTQVLKGAFTSDHLISSHLTSSELSGGECVMVKRSSLP